MTVNSDGSKRVVWIDRTGKSRSMTGDSLHISDRGTLTMTREVYDALGRPERVDIAVVPDQGRIMIQPGKDWSVFSRKGRSSPQVSLMTALRSIGIKDVEPGKRSHTLVDGRLFVNILTWAE